MNPEPQWHDFPLKNGLYALRGDGYITITRIYSMDNGSSWYYRNECQTCSYPFDPEFFKGVCYGPIELPKV